MRGAFMPENANLAAGVLTGFCTGMFFTAAYNFMVRYFYSRGSFNTPFVSALFTCALDVVLSLALIRTPLGVAGLAYANSLAFSLSFFILALLAYFKYGRFGLAHLFLPFLKVVLACLLSVGVYFVLNHFVGFNWWQQRSSLKTFGLLALSGLSMLMIVLLAYKLLKVNFLEGLRRKTNNR
jgi:putative peptidoglycan lipid II flippase